MAARRALLSLLLLGLASASRIKYPRSSPGDDERHARHGRALAKNDGAVKNSVHADTNETAKQEQSPSSMNISVNSSALNATDKQASLVQGASVGMEVPTKQKMLAKHAEKDDSFFASVPRSAKFAGLVVGVLCIIFCIWAVVSKLVGLDDPKDAKKVKKPLTSNDSLLSAGTPGSMGSNGTKSMGTRSDFSAFGGGRKPHFHNGRMVYEWAQSDSVAKIYLKPPDSVTKDDLEIQITHQSLAVGCKGKPKFINEETYAQVDVENSAWKINKKGELEIHMAKIHKADWPCALRDAGVDGGLPVQPSAHESFKVPK
jgi:hypothetical protein